MPPPQKLTRRLSASNLPVSNPPHLGRRGQLNRLLKADLPSLPAVVGHERPIGESGLLRHCDAKSMGSAEMEKGLALCGSLQALRRGVRTHKREHRFSSHVEGAQPMVSAVQLSPAMCNPSM